MSADDFKAYNERFNSEADVRATVKACLDHNAEQIRGSDAHYQLLRDKVTEADGRIARNIGCTAEACLRLLYQTVATAGLSRWAPEVITGGADSMYNLLHEHIALLTFQQICDASGYDHIGATHKWYSDPGLMKKLYRSFVFSYMRGKARAERKNPGTAVQNVELNNITKRRQEVSYFCYCHYLNSKFVVHSFL